MEFKLNPEWMMKEPLDFEYNKYTLLDYLQKCERRLNNLEIYPDFVELSLHLANLQSLSKENTLLLTDKKFKSCDDEILLKELYTKKPRKLSDEEESELDKTIRFSGYKLFDTFNIAKSIWNIAFENVQVVLKKIGKELEMKDGYIFYYKKENDFLHVWEYQMKKDKKNDIHSKTNLKLIYQGNPEDLTLNNIISGHTSTNRKETHSKLPIFEMKATQEFPMDQTLVPIMKRKVTAFIYQRFHVPKIKNFDSQL